MTNLIIFGAPGVGKGTQAEALSKNYQLTHLSTGELLRNNIEKKTELGKKVKSYLDSGNLVPDNLVLEMIKETIEDPKANGFIFDGFPRTAKQAEDFDEILKEKNQSISAILVLEAPESELITRLQKRAKKLNRSDDSSLETIKKRLGIYKDKTKSLIGYYKAQNKAIFIDGVGDIDEITEKLKTEIDKLQQ